MYNRRKFIKATALSAAAVTLSKACTIKTSIVNKPI
ncbi:MAG: twin-arginine translocation signal domain-containing protein, partial [Bacteroidia bacterium]